MILSSVYLTSVTDRLCHVDKEEWLPFLKHLFEANNVNLAEAWCVDLYSHGDSLPYNKDLVMSNPEMGTCLPFHMLLQYSDI